MNELERKCNGISISSQFGHSKLFIKEPHYAWLERYRDVVRDRASVKLKGLCAVNDRTFVTSLKSYKKLMRNAMDRGDLGKAQELLQTLKTRVEGHDVMLEEAAMLEELLERRSRQDAQKRIQKQQPPLSSTTTTTTIKDNV